MRGHSRARPWAESGMLIASTPNRFSSSAAPSSSFVEQSKPFGGTISTIVTNDRRRQSSAPTQRALSAAAMRLHSLPSSSPASAMPDCGFQPRRPPALPSPAGRCASTGYAAGVVPQQPPTQLAPARHQACARSSPCTPATSDRCFALPPPSRQAGIRHGEPAAASVARRTCAGSASSTTSRARSLQLQPQSALAPAARQHQLRSVFRQTFPSRQLTCSSTVTIARPPAVPAPGFFRRRAAPDLRLGFSDWSSFRR